MKKELTAKQKRTRSKRISRLAYGGEFVSTFAPYGVMAAINADTWFVNQEGWKIALGGILAMTLMAIAMLAITKKKEDTDSKTGGYVTLLLTWLAVAFIFQLLANIMNQISEIMFFGALGIAGALGLDIVSKKYAEEFESYNAALKKVNQDNREEEVRKELQAEQEQKKKVVIKIKK